MSRVVNLDDLLLSINAVFDSRTARRVTEYLRDYPAAIEVKENNKWIPVTERLPEKNVQVLIYAKSMSRSGDVYTLGSCSNGCWFTESGVGLLSYPNGNRYKTLAWMPLPEPYEDKQHE